MAADGNKAMKAAVGLAAIVAPLLLLWLLARCLRAAWRCCCGRRAPKARQLPPQGGDGDGEEDEAEAESEWDEEEEAERRRDKDGEWKSKRDFIRKYGGDRRNTPIEWDVADQQRRGGGDGAGASAGGELRRRGGSKGKGQAQGRAKTAAKGRAAAPAAPAAVLAAAAGRPAKAAPARERRRNPTPAAAPPGQLKGLKGALQDVCLGAKGDYVFAASVDRTYRLFAASSLGAKETKALTVRLGKVTVTLACFDTSCEFLATYIDTDRKVIVYYVDPRNELREPGGVKEPMKQHWEARVRAADFSRISCGPGGGFVCLCDETGGVTVIDRTGKEAAHEQHRGTGARGWAQSNDGSLIALAAGMNTARVYGVLAGRSTLDDSSPLWAGVQCEAYDENDGRWLRATVFEANDDGTYTVDWGQGQYSYAVPRRHLKAKGLQTTGSSFGGLRQAMVLGGHKKDVSCVGLRGDGLMAVTCSDDGAVRLWDTEVRWHQQEEPKLVAAFNDTDYVDFCAAAIAPNGKLVVLATTDGALLFYMIEKATAKLYGEITGAHPTGGQLSALFFVAKGVLLSCSEADTRVRLWSLPGCIPKISER